MSYQALAFFTGLFGSLHCAAMCGPLMMALPYPGDPWSAMMQKLLHQAGRIGMYMVLGLIVGAVGHSLNLIGLQGPISIISGILLLFGACLVVRKPGSPLPQLGMDKFYTFLSRSFATLLSASYGGILTGLLHGLLPCGMVYLALAGALSTSESAEAAMFMMYFGLGTTPVLLAASVLPLSIRRFRASQFLIPAMMLVAGILLMIRGFNVDIPHVHPRINTAKSAPVC